MNVIAESRHHTASAVVFDMRHRLVLVVAHKLTGQWQLPGGHIDADETGAEAAIREVLEETGVKADLWTGPHLQIPGGIWHPSPIMTVEFNAPASPAWGEWPPEPAHRHIDHLYAATADSATSASVQIDEIDGLAWLPIDCLNTADVRPDVPVVVPVAWNLITQAGTR